MHNEDWNNTQYPVRGTRECRVAIERIDNEFGGDAMTFAAAELFPEERNGPALEGEEEEEIHAV